ncbi:MAG: hypothetical protein AXA67_10380 [Methylothermaceae bacteria B42]|nr:MAG: hypothetical protein AXA67_10380 [Methylothermaceae bacteria B42]HHJ40525.1 sulfurtransferase complex subunit TusC [Methylothermaceae bacterium]
MISLRYLLVLRSMPFDGLHVQEALEQLMTLAAFEQPSSVLFVEDGVWALKQAQQPGQLGYKNLSGLIQSLALYDIGPLWVEKESLLERGLNEKDLIVSVQTIERSHVPSLMDKHDRLLPG